MDFYLSLHYAKFLTFLLIIIDKIKTEIRENYRKNNGMYLQNYAYVSCRVGVIKIVIVINCNLITFSKVIACNCNLDIS